MTSFDVVIPCYNDQQRVNRAAASAIGAGAERVIVVDDGSPEPIRVDEPAERIRQDNAGPGAARNTGMRASLAPWVVLLDSDDLLLPEIRCLVELADRSNAVGGVGDRWFVSASGSRRRAEIPSVWTNSTLPSADDAFAPVSIFSGTGQVVSRRAIDNGIAYDTSYRCGEDMEFIHRLALFGSIAVHAEPVAEYFEPGDSNLSGLGNLDRAATDVLSMCERYAPTTNREHWRARWAMLLRQYAKHGRNPSIFARFSEVGRSIGCRVPMKRRRQFWSRRVASAIGFGSGS